MPLLKDFIMKKENGHFQVATVSKEAWDSVKSHGVLSIQRVASWKEVCIYLYALCMVKTQLEYKI